MQVEVKKEVSILWRKSHNNFMFENLKSLSEPTRYIGSAVNAVNYMLGCADEMKVLMRSILGTDPNSREQNWDKVLANYWHSLQVQVFQNGKILQIGYIYDIDDVEKQEAIDKLKVSKPSIKSSEDLVKYCETKEFHEEYRYKYGMPINIEEYLLWRYCLKYSHVANTPEEVNKSNNIRFYLWSAADERRLKLTDYKSKMEAMQKASTIIASEELTTNVVCLMVDSQEIINTLYPSIEDKHLFIMDQARNNPDKLIAIASDKNLVMKVMIERMVFNNILKRIANTSIIVDSENSEIVIGNTLDEAVSYMSSSSEQTKPRIAEYKAKLAKVDSTVNVSKVK